MVSRFRIREVRDTAKRIQAQLQAWGSSESVAALAEARPGMPSGLHDREEDVWEPLLAIADLAGADWPTAARATAQRLAQSASQQDDSLGVRLLADIKAVLDDHPEDRIPTTVLLERLSEIEEAPWADSIRGRPLTKERLASLLRPYGIKPGQWRVGDHRHRGYAREDFADAWSRYLVTGQATDDPPSGRVESVTPGTPLSRSGSEPRDAPGRERIASQGRMAQEALFEAGVPDVTDRGATEAHPERRRPTEDESVASRLMDTGAALGYPELPLGPGRTLVSGVDAWFKFMEFCLSRIADGNQTGKHDMTAVAEARDALQSKDPGME